MLNEWIEAEAYLGQINTGCRVQPKLLTGNFKGKLNGLREILVVIVRAFMFEHMEDDKCSVEIHDRCIMALKLWCGFYSEDELVKYREDEVIKSWLNKYPHAEGWLKDYFSFYGLDEKSSFNWKYYKDRWSKELDTGNVYQVKSFTYENVLADALGQGELKEYFLTFSKEETLWESMGGGKRKVDMRAQRKILKFIAAYLLASRFIQQKTVIFKKIPVLNWMGIDNDNKVSCFPIQSWKGAPFYESIPYVDFVKVRMNEDFMKEYDIQLIEKEQVEEYLGKGYSVYRDAGHGKEAAQALYKLSY